MCHISYCETFRIYLLITGNQFGIVAALWWRSHAAKPGSRQTQNVDDDIDEFAPLEAFIVPHLRGRFYAKFGVTTKARHLPGVENRVADLLSRWEQVGDPRKTLEDLTGGVELVEESIDESAFKFSFVWWRVQYGKS